MDYLYRIDNGTDTNGVCHVLLRGNFHLPMRLATQPCFGLACDVVANYSNHLVFNTTIKDDKLVITSKMSCPIHILKRHGQTPREPLLIETCFMYDKCDKLESPRETPFIQILGGDTSQAKRNSPHRINLSWPLAIQVDNQTSSLYSLLAKGIESFIEFYSHASLASWERFQRLVEIEMHTFHILNSIYIIAFPRKEIGYLDSISEQDDKRLRKDLHQAIGLSEDWPQFRRCQSLRFHLSSANGCLVNPHETITPRHPSTTTALVKGRYTYKHYQQDGEQDKNWGCAYRSLQTIVSWFQWQGFHYSPDKALPTLLEIQDTLVRLRDKPSGFSGSKQWIGSFEVSLCIKEMCGGLDAKIIHVSAGVQMGEQVRTLLDHFETEGTPVMIGGGVLAHTILGVNLDSATDTVKFLVLDPHYIGPDELKPVLDKGWCGWKDVKFWVPTEHYNMCLPQRPRDI